MWLFVAGLKVEWFYQGHTEPAQISVLYTKDGEASGFKKWRARVEPDSKYYSKSTNVFLIKHQVFNLWHGFCSLNALSWLSALRCHVERSDGWCKSLWIIHGDCQRSANKCCTGGTNCSVRITHGRHRCLRQTKRIKLVYVYPLNCFKLSLFNCLLQNVITVLFAV